MSEIHLPPLQSYIPATFQERGVALPFTTPQLFGARGRAARDGGIELILPNPSGGRGAYVLDCANLHGFCRPTLHDRHLIKRILDLPSPTPRAVRDAAVSIAAAGLAGEDAKNAASIIRETERRETIACNYALLMSLVYLLDRVEPTARSSDAAQDQEADLERRAQSAVARIAARMGESRHWVASGLEALADILHPIGLRTMPEPARLGRTRDRIRRVRAGVAAWETRNVDNPLGNFPGIFGTIADLAVALSTTMLDQVLLMTDDPITLLRVWSDDPDRIRHLATQPEWMLDGWEPLCLLWDHARHNADQRAALAEIAVLVPVLPREIIDWAELGRYEEVINQIRRPAAPHDDWRGGIGMQELIARNEHLRAMAA